MDIPSWVPRLKVELLQDPETGEWIEVTYKLAPKTQQKVKPKKGEVDGGYGERRRQFMHNVAAGAGFLLDKDFAAREKSTFQPIDDVLFLMWQQHNQNSVDNFDIEKFRKDWDGEYLKYLRYCPHSQMALLAVYEKCKEEAKELFTSDPRSYQRIARNVVQNKWWLRDAWVTWAKLNPSEAKEVAAKIKELKEAR